MLNICRFCVQSGKFYTWQNIFPRAPWFQLWRWPTWTLGTWAQWWASAPGPRRRTRRQRWSHPGSLTKGGLPSPGLRGTGRQGWTPELGHPLQAWVNFFGPPIRPSKPDSSPPPPRWWLRAAAEEEDVETRESSPSSSLQSHLKVFCLKPFSSFSSALTTNQEQAVEKCFFQWS